MNFETITINEYSGNNFSGSKLAKLYSNGSLEYLEPEYDEEDEEEEQLLCMRKS